MLSERLKKKDLFDHIVVDEQDARDRAKKTLRDAVNGLVIAMKFVQDAGIMDSEEAESLVIAYLEAYEKRYYAMFDDEFAEFLENFLGL